MSEATLLMDRKLSPPLGFPPERPSRKFERDLARRAESRLQESGYPALRDIRCDSRDRAVVLRGHVASYYLKQVAQELVRRVEGVEMIVNMLEVGAS